MLEDRLFRIDQEEIIQITNFPEHTTVMFTGGRYSCSCASMYNPIYPFKMQPIDREIEPRNENSNERNSRNIPT